MRAIFPLTALAFFVATTIGLARVGLTLLEHGLPLALFVVIVASVWLAIAVATAEVWLGRSARAR